MTKKTIESLIDTINGVQLIHVTDNRKRPTDAYELRRDNQIVAWAHANGGMFALNLGDPNAPLSSRHFVGLVKTREAVLDSLRIIAARS